MAGWEKMPGEAIAWGGLGIAMQGLPWIKSEAGARPSQILAATGMAVYTNYMRGGKDKQAALPLRTLCAHDAGCACTSP